MAEAGLIGIEAQTGLTSRPGKLPTASTSVVSGSADGVGSPAIGGKGQTRAIPHPVVVIGERNHVGGWVDPTGRTVQIESITAVPLKPIGTALPMAFEITTVEGPLISHIGEGIERLIA